MAEDNLKEIQAKIRDLTYEIKSADRRADAAEKESESRRQTIEKLKKLHEKALEDFNQSNAQLSMRNQQINSLKETVKNLQQQTTDLASEKQTIQLKYDSSADTIKSQKDEIERLNKGLDESINDLNQHPAFIKLKNENKVLVKNISIEKEGRIAALAAWQKVEKKIKNRECEKAEHESSYLKDVKDLRLKNEELQQQLRWANQKLDASRDTNQTLDRDYKMSQEENMNLKMRLNALDSEIRSQAQIEQMKSKNFIDSAVTEMKWREHLLIQQLEKCSADLNKARMEKFKYQKAVRTMEVEIGNNENIQIQNNPKRSAIIKRKFAELSDLDAEINKLRKEIKHGNALGINPSKWVRNPPPPSFMQPQRMLALQNPNPNNQSYHSPQVANQVPFASPMPPYATSQQQQGHHYVTPQQQQQQARRNLNMSSNHHSPMKHQHNHNNMHHNKPNRRRSKHDAQLLSPNSNVDDFWSDLYQSPQQPQYADSYAPPQRNVKRKRKLHGIPTYPKSDRPPKQKRRARRKGRKVSKAMTDGEKPRWRFGL